MSMVSSKSAEGFQKQGCEWEEMRGLADGRKLRVVDGRKLLGKAG